MDTLYKAYQAYERRVMRGEFYGPAYRPCKAAAQREPLLAHLGNLFTHTGRRLKAWNATRTLMTWSALGGSKP
jgi:hypothetical protein